MKSHAFPLILASIILSSFTLGCQKSSPSQNIAVRNVILTDVEQNSSSVSKNYPGVVEEGKTVNASFMTGGKILSLKAKEGDRVRKGDLLATLDDSDYQIGVSQLRVQYDQMTAEKKRMEEMFARNNIAPNDYEKFEAGYEQLKLQLQMANNKLGYTKLYSPSNGFISYRYMEPGELVDAGTPIYKIIDDSSLEVSVDLPLQLFLKKNDIKEAYGTMPNIEGEIPLKISSFTPDADNNQLYHMKLDIPAKYKSDITTGMNMNVRIEINNEDGGYALIPSRAVFNENGKSYVWTFNNQDSTISKKEVIISGPPHENKSMVSGLQGNEKIVSSGVKQLTEGEKVNVVEGVLK